MDELPNMDASDAVRYDRVDPRILAMFPDLVNGLGGSAEKLLLAVRIKPPVMRGEDLVVNYRQMVNLLALSATELGCVDFGMRLARLQAGAIQSPLLQVVHSSATLGEALDHVIQHSYAHSRAASIWLRPHPDDGIVMLGHDILIEGVPDKRQAIEQILLVEYLTCLAATGERAQARRVDFRHEPVADTSVYRAHFGCPVRFAQPVDAIVYDAKTLSAPIIAPDRATCSAILERISRAFVDREQPLHVKVRGLITHLLGYDDCSNLIVAAELELHPRAMHRKLAQEATSFQRIKNEVRQDLLLYYLDQTDLAFTEISERLGFSEQSAMTRFCQKWLSVSPTERRGQSR